MKYIAGVLVIGSLVVSSVSANLVPLGKYEPTALQFTCVDIHEGHSLFPDYMRSKTDTLYKCDIDR